MAMDLLLGGARRRALAFELAVAHDERPATTVSAGLTWKVEPANGVTRPCEWKRSGSTVHGRCR